MELSGATNSSGSGKIKVDKRAKLHFVKRALKKLVEHFFFGGDGLESEGEVLVEGETEVDFRWQGRFQLCGQPSSRNSYPKKGKVRFMKLLKSLFRKRPIGGDGLKNEGEVQMDGEAEASVPIVSDDIFECGESCDLSFVDDVMESEAMDDLGTGSYTSGSYGSNSDLRRQLLGPSHVAPL